ncbi:outer membrane protein [Paraburkholderia sp. RAU6.4a]|uniref:OmpW/AlkL family protein n=1 Tax=Paraburkholderia sp. RAU6.4a TaxID=2991067 RepID=UPI003D1B5C40
MNAYSALAESPAYRCTYSKPSRVVTPFVTAIIIGLTTTAHADQGDILARFRLVSLEPVAQSTGILNAIGTGVNNTLAPEVDFTYMATNHIGIELILGSPRVSVTSNLGELGRVSLLPPTLTAAWHFNPNGLINPYVGAGINYTLLYNSNLSAGGQKLEITRHSFGPAFQAGVDIRLTARTFFNLDVKKIYTHTDATLGGASLGTLKVNPWLFGVGVGMRF